jgi:hypothetical protein
MAGVGALYRSQMKNPSFPQSLERESAALTVAGVGALYRSQMKNPSFPQSLERESAALTVAGVGARYRSRIMSINLIKVEIAS